MRYPIHLALALAGAVVVLAGTTGAQDRRFIEDKVIAPMRWRNLGPARFGGRIVDIAVHPQKTNTFWVAAGSGGLFKTTNHGTSFTAQFQFQRVMSIGAIAVAPSAPDTLYLGSGEANNQRSSYWGDGVYKSTDGGATWKNIGLKGTDHIGRVVVHPTDPETVYVAALGALYSPNEDRGVYRTTNGGANWSKVKFVSQDVGFVDIVMDPHDPKTLYAASYERRRRAWNFDPAGPGSGIYKTTDGGDTWTRLTGGLPTGEIGRIGLAMFKGPETSVLFAAVENGNPGQPRPAARRRGGRDEDPEEAPQGRDRVPTIGGQVFRSADGGERFTKISGDASIGGSPGYYYGQIRVDPTDEKRIYVLSVPVHCTTDGGRTWQRADRGIHVDHHALWINPKNPRHLLLGNDGGIHVSYDHGAHWDHLNHLSLGQFYAVTADNSDPYWIYGGTQDNGSWGIPSRGTRSEGVKNKHAVKVSGGDGFYVQVDPTDPAIIYSESQFGALGRLDLRTGERKGIRPAQERGMPRLRFNWSAPIHLSHHNPRTLYFGSQYLHRSIDRGDSWETISPDLTTSDRDKLKGDVPHCTITTIAESTKQRGLLMVGTDDGKVWMTRDGGGRWTDLTDRFDRQPRSLWVSRVELSPSDPDTAYVAFTGYREDIREAFLYMTTDGGVSFRSIVNDLPSEPINVVREHPRNKDVLFVGTEFSIYCSLNAGGNWYPLHNDLPSVACHDLLVHPRESDLIAGTHGRGILVLDITPLEELDQAVLAKAFHVFPPRDGFMQKRAWDQGYVGNRDWTADRQSGAATFSYYLAQDTAEDVTIRVLDAKGDRLFNQAGSKSAGLHRVEWGRGGGRGRGGRGGGFGQALGRMFGSALGGAPRPGNYVVEIAHGDTVVRRPFSITGDAPPLGPRPRGGEDEPPLIR